MTTSGECPEITNSSSNEMSLPNGIEQEQQQQQQQSMTNPQSLINICENIQNNEMLIVVNENSNQLINSNVENSVSLASLASSTTEPHPSGSEPEPMSASAVTAATPPATPPVAPTNNQQPTEKEKELLDLIFNMENDKQNFLDKVRVKIQDSQMELKKSNEQKTELKRKINELEIQIRNLNKNNSNTGGSGSGNGNGSGGRNATINNRTTKKASNRVIEEQEEVLMKAKTLLFEKSKLCKQQEQQLAAVNNQLGATKDVAGITKEMLNLRNIENAHMQARLDTMALRVKSETDRLQLTEKKLEVTKKMYSDLKTEYDLQAEIYKQLKSTYEEKIELLTKQLTESRAKEA